jgi:hypothetical protein
MFLYLPFQAVPVPWNDLEGLYPDGIPEEYLDKDTYDYISDTFEV